MSVLETTLLFVVLPLGLYLVIALLAAGKGIVRRPRYRPNEPWNYPPVWWSANPKGAGLPDEVEPVETASSNRGGAHGSW